MKLSLSVESANALRELAESIPIAVQNIVESTLKVITTYQGVSETLGEHRQNFYDMLLLIKKAQEVSAEAISVLPKMLCSTADKIDAYIANIPVQTSSSTNWQGGNVRISNDSSGSIFPKSKWELPVSSNYLSGLPIRKGNNSMWEVVTATISAYDEYRNDCDNFSHDDFDVVETRIIDAREISGIGMISEADRENPEKFWKMHAYGEQNYESFEAIATQIPEVQKRLETGESLSSLLNDAQMGRCAKLFFDTSSVDHPTVYEGDGFYELFGGGRHRIMLAQKFGFSIPVRVRGRITHI